MPRTIEFRHRAHEVSRLEAFSDVIFGFAISLLVVSLEAPKSYGDLMEIMHGFLPFAICFFLFIDIWWEHHDFFKRYALHDRVVSVLNTFLLFVVLFYVYPLKYMFTLFVSGMQGEDVRLPAGAAATLFTLYGLGVAAVFWTLAFLYAHAWRRRDPLQLNEVERIDTLESIADNVAMGAFGIVSLILANIGLARFAGFVYFLIAVPKTIVPWTLGNRRRKAEARMLATREADAGAVPSPA
jgi:uncharacterized membrane protein